MKYELKYTLPEIKQERSDWCIPASIEISLKYLRPTVAVSQEELWNLLNGKQPNFVIYKEILSMLLKFNSFTFENWGPGDSKSLRKEIEKGLSNNFPVLISTPAIPPANGWHIRVCNKIENDKLTMFDPGDALSKEENISDITEIVKVKGGGDILTIGLKNKTE